VLLLRAAVVQPGSLRRNIEFFITHDARRAAAPPQCVWEL